MGLSDRNIDYEIEKQKAIEKELGCEIIRINPDENDYNIFKSINEICRYVKESTEKSSTDKISK